MIASRLAPAAGGLLLAIVLAPTALADDAASKGVPAKPDVSTLLTGFDALWHPSSTPLHGEERDGAVLAHNDEMVSWINGHATASQQTRALQDSLYRTSSGERYDQSLTIADGLGRTLGDLYLEGRRTGKLPLTSALLDSSDGSAGDYVSTGEVKARFSYPRPFLRARPDDHSACTPTNADASSLADNRQGRPWADARGDLSIERVAVQRDSSHRFVDEGVDLDPHYDSLCLSGSFPSGHTVTAYQAGTTLATLVPEAAPGLLARVSEAANNRLVLGVHYPLDVIGGRMAAQAGIATLWADPGVRSSTLEPARKELRDYLRAGCTKKLGVSTLADCVAKDAPYADDPYDGSRVPGGTAQKVTDRASALAVYTERLSYGFDSKSAVGQQSSSTPSSSSTHQDGSGASPSRSTSNDAGVATTAGQVPATAAALLRTTYPSLSDEQRRAVLARTAIPAGNPLAVGDGAGWQRLDLAAAMSQHVTVDADGAVNVAAADRASVDGPGAMHATAAPHTSSPSGEAHSTSPWPVLATGPGVVAAAAVIGAIVLGRRRRS